MTTNATVSGGYELRRLRLLFYVAIPFAIAFLLGWVQVGRTAEWPKAIALLYWFGHVYVGLFFLEVGTPPIAHLLRPRGVPLWVTVIIGQFIIGWIAILPFSRFYVEWVHTFLAPELVGPLQTSSLAEVLQRIPSNIVFWLGINLLFFYVLGMPRFGYVPRGPSPAVADPRVAQPPGAAAAGSIPEPDARESLSAAPASHPVNQPAFMAHVRPDRFGNLLALHADGHYIHVYTDAGADMILYRLGDAIAELGDDAQGLRVHRSWWVADRAIAPDGVSVGRLSLVNGLEVPVSRSNRSLVKSRWSLTDNANSLSHI